MLGLKLLRGKLKEAAICLSAGRVTLPYPLRAGRAPAPGFRGLPRVDASRCIGCGGCASVCTPNLITDRGRRAAGPLHLVAGPVHLLRPLRRGVPGGRGHDERGVRDRHRPTSATCTLTVDVFMASCNRCGRCYRTQTPLDPPHPRPFHDGAVEALCDEWKGRARTSRGRRSRHERRRARCSSSSLTLGDRCFAVVSPSRPARWCGPPTGTWRTAAA